MRRTRSFVLLLICVAATTGAATAWVLHRPAAQATHAVPSVHADQGVQVVGATERTERESAGIQAAAHEFLSSLTAAQRSKTLFSLDDAERTNWHFVPRPRRGLSLGDMSEQQRALARGVLRAGLSETGYLTASTIIELENVLREMGESPAFRDPELYYFSIFGTPSRTSPWGFRAEGHHLSLNFTIIGDTLVATAPAFLGANPAEVRSGARRGLRALANEEDVGRELVLALDDRQREQAIIAATAPSDIVTGNAARVEPLSPVGIRVTQLRPEQRALLLQLLDVYIGRMADSVATRRRAALERTDFSEVTFAWAGSTRRGEPHYYRIQGPSFLVEYDNTQNGANHVHTVWRDFDGDFGRDLLREHYRSATHPD